MPRRDRRSATEISLQARKAAHVLHSKHDSRDLTRKARQAFFDSFEKKADPFNELEPVERQRRADQLISAHFTDMARRSVATRRRQKHGG
ncbi:MAG: hypothetical protein IH867_06590 [Chloroflexi bacterium]|nr:hypothetical protein [Chloroflexota bacterium]